MRAAASAGPSNGAMFPLLSYAQPITIGFVAADVLLPAAASAANATAAARSVAATRHLLAPLMRISHSSRVWLGRTGERSIEILTLRAVRVNRMPTTPRAP